MSISTARLWPFVALVAWLDAVLVCVRFLAEKEFAARSTGECAVYTMATGKMNLESGKKEPKESLSKKTGARKDRRRIGSTIVISTLRCSTSLRSASAFCGTGTPSSRWGPGSTYLAHPH